jgi:hypothetical protein
MREENQKQAAANHTYAETLSSARTEALFIVLTGLFAALFAWRVMAAGWDLLATGLLAATLFFLFCALNYRALRIRLTAQELTLSFGLFTWTVPLATVERCYRDDVSLWRIGGAGIHFTWIGGRYRAMFNFLEYPRLVIALREKKGPVWDIAFSTRRPDQIQRFLKDVLAEQRAA